MDNGTRHITLLGSTGSIGQSSLEAVRNSGGRFKVAALAANKKVELLKRQILEFRPEIAAVADDKSADELRRWVKADGISGVNVLSADQGVCEAAAYEKSDFVISAIVGAVGLRPTLAAIKAGKNVGLANKETLVMAGTVVMEEAKKYNVKILPVDSEHSAIFQCIDGRPRNHIRRLILTASGGPFFGRRKDALTSVTASDALRHPSWSMGNKITIDSATLMNKGLEVIEAYHLFGLPADSIDVVIHPQSIVHSLIELVDGSLLAQLSVPDMKGPIAYALSYPDRMEGAIKRLSLEEISTLTFHKPDTEAFHCLALAYEALKSGGTMPAALNAANEELVYMFLKGVINFTQIPVIIEEVMMRHNVTEARLEAVFEADRWAREVVQTLQPARGGGR
ncbi:MAG: 1-deoxy-D-xylulose-5-phosphate reductoisomerase [Candidatus Magnetominusculus sp. LBB02]|nr:1-deoxy-D-xylulose-5-phosphate reductoisomerase [Candidatus Magnetominusculus sp. LBB02]